MVKRDWIINTWFSNGSSARLRTAAIGYLAKCGSIEDLKIAEKEYDRSDHRTTRSALECMLEILLRSGQAEAAQQLVLKSQFKSLNTSLLRSVIDGFEIIETPALLLGLEHRNFEVRLRAMKTLRSRGVLKIGMAEKLSLDSNALIRTEAVSALLELGKPLSEKETKKILSSPQKQTGVLGLGFGNALSADNTGEELFQKYQLDALKNLSEAELEKRVGTSLLPDDPAYFALVERYFKNHANELRRDIDDRFSAYFEERISRIYTALGDGSASEKLVKGMRDLEDFLRKKLTRKGLNVLCAVKKPKDLQRIRANLRDGYAGASKLDAEYLSKHGEWPDIPMLARAATPKVGATLLTTFGNEEFQFAVAKAIISISKKHSIADLLSLEMPAAILKKIIELSAESRFAKLSQNVLMTLLDHESDGVRKAAAVMAVRALTRKRIKSVLRKYVGSDKYRYYNVIHWLDLGASMHRDYAKKVARAISD